MKETRIRWAIAGAATAILLLSACGDDDDSSTTTSEASTTTSEAAATARRPSRRAKTWNSSGTIGLGGQTLNITAEEENGEVTGEFRVTDNVVTVECADTHTDGVVILGGEATEGPDVAVGDLLALIIREGDPDSVALCANDSGAASCTELLESIPETARRRSDFVDVEDGYDIETA